MLPKGWRLPARARPILFQWPSAEPFGPQVQALQARGELVRAPDEMLGDTEERLGARRVSRSEWKAEARVWVVLLICVHPKQPSVF